MNITILADGGWGTAVALLLDSNGHRVTIWGPFADHIETMKSTRRNDRFLPGPELPPTLALTADMEEAVADAELLVLASPTQYARGTLEKLAAAGGAADLPLVNLAKGIEVGSLLRLSELCDDVLGSCDYIVMSGPSHAEEVSRRVLWPGWRLRGLPLWRADPVTEGPGTARHTRDRNRDSLPGKPATPSLPPGIFPAVDRRHS